MFDLDLQDLEIRCPECRFFEEVRFREVRMRNVYICRGCKLNLRLDDHMNEFRKARKQFTKIIDDLQSELSSLNIKINIRL